ncbi:MAG: efflux RND transporter permease subunit [Pedobacter sp.]|uniref:efflux RND transporter permease subunit n=1 Tax=Pedobacter sp. TaxID=1411316 RepID=UPI0028069B24|nr:efflux RND transporter permease subunit [Pedobacter sp.]MDQ8004415.1 efflux RND transporter permease subunit [Pedobacter sp.]
MFKKFIDRPVLSTVISIIILILGVLGIITLPVSQYPEIAPPTVQVSASYQGANADVVMSSVVVPLEEQINGVEDMTYMTSSAGNDGSATITINFKLGTNPDLAAVNVQNRVARATSLLPAEVTRAGVITAKRQSSDVLIFALHSEDPAYDQKFLQNYAEINIIPQIKRVTGVGDVSAFSQSIYTMRLWLKPDVMAAYGLVPNDISAVLADQNIEAAPGQLGEQGLQSFQYTLKYTGRLKDETQFGDIIIRTAANGQVLKLKDIARIEMGAQSYASSIRLNGKPGLGFRVNQTAGSNAKEVIEGALNAMKIAEADFPKGIKYEVLTNVNDFLDASIEKVLHTLVEAFILVFIVVFIFLQDFKSTLIPAISVPVAIVGTFFFLSLFGFTINLLTLFALVLAIGIVVDDAIVVVEAVHSKLDQGYKSAKKATEDAMDEITGAIISITLVMAAVFLPVSFISGSSGVFFKQFGLTLAIAIILSAINALTLSPALCALLLKPHKDDHHEKKGFMKRFYAAFNTSFETMTRKYKGAVYFLAKRKWLSGLGLLAFVAAFVWTFNTTPKGFVPNEDLGAIMSDISLPPGTSQERTEEIVTKIDSIAQTIPEVRLTLRVVGRAMISGSGSSYGMVITRLKPWDERKRDVKTIIGELFAKTANIKEAKIIFFAPPTISGFGMGGGFEFQLQDRTGGTITNFSEVANKFLAALNQRPEIQYAATSFNPNFPQYLITANVAKIKQAGLNVNDVMSVMQGYYGGVYASNFNKFGKQYRVVYQADPQYRANLESLNSVYVRTPGGAMAPISGFISTERVYGPQTISRFNLYTSIAVTGNPKPGFSSGDALKAVEEEAAKHLPQGYGYEYSGLSREEQASGNQTVFIFLLCLIFVYFLLCAQYESYVLPLAVILSLPVGLAGVFIFDKIFGIDNNIYTQITLIMLIGLLAKNAILIVEFAAERRRRGMTIMQAALEGATARLRPILMTSFAFILGIMPLMLSFGVGAAGNTSIGTGAVGGMLFGTVFGVFIIPVLFIVFQTLQEKVSSKSPYDESVMDRQTHLNFDKSENPED